MTSVTDEMVQAFKLAYVSGPVKSLSPENERIRRSLQAAIDAHLSRDAVVIEVTPKMIAAGMAWFHGWQHMRKGSKESALEEAFKAMLAQRDGGTK